MTPVGEIVWSWYAKDEYDVAPYADIDDEGWTHANAVTRLSNGNTLVSLRNFNLTVEVDPDGDVVCHGAPETQPVMGASNPASLVDYSIPHLACSWQGAGPLSSFFRVCSIVTGLMGIRSARGGAFAWFAFCPARVRRVACPLQSVG